VLRFKVFDPEDGSLVADDVPNAGAADVDAAVAAAEAAYPAWKKLDPEARRAMMMKLADLIEIPENAETLLALTSATLGQPLSMKWTAYFCARLLRYYASWIGKVKGESWPQDDGYVSTTSIVINNGFTDKSR
jgi:aldehyde dehydrogenase (NAD+)